MDGLIAPCGNRLVDLIVPAEEAEELKARAVGLPSVQLTERQVCDLELLATGAFSPLDRFMGRADYERVLVEMRLDGGHLFPVPVTLSVEPSPTLRLDRSVALRTSGNVLLGVLDVEEIYEWDLAEEALNVCGTLDGRHPLVAEMHRWGRVNISGRVRVVAAPRHFDFRGLRLTPAQTRAKLKELGRANVVAFQTRNPLHRAHEEMTKRAIRDLDGVLLLHPAVGMTKPGDVDHYTRVRACKALAAVYYEPERILLSLLPLAMRMAGPREALWHALIRRNYGANHFIVGRDHASPGLDSKGEPFYGPYEAQELVGRFVEELGVGVMPFRELVYLPGEDRYEEVSRLSPGVEVWRLSGTQARENYLDRGEPLPEWFTRREVAQVLAETYPPRHRQGFCVWFTGLSGAGKTTTAEVLTMMLLEKGRRVTVLDGDVVRTNLSKGLGFTREDRDANIRRIGFVAAEVVRHGGVALCAAVSPYVSTRDEVRALVGEENFIEAYVDTPLEVCEARDGKGLYAKARRGEIPNFTGISDPYEPPLNAEIVLDALNVRPEENARRIMQLLAERGFLRVERAGVEV